MFQESFFIQRNETSRWSYQKKLSPLKFNQKQATIRDLWGLASLSWKILSWSCSEQSRRIRERAKKADGENENGSFRDTLYVNVEL